MHLQPFNHRGIEKIILALLLIEITLASGFLVFEVFGAGSIVRRQSIQVGFQNQWEEMTMTYMFSLDGNLNVEDSRGSQFFFVAPKFQPNVPYTMSLSENESFVTQYFFVNGTDKHGVVQTLHLWVDYDFSRFRLGSKITLRGNTTDPDSEVEYEFQNPQGLNMASNATSYWIGGILFDWSDLQGATTFEFAVNKLKVKFASTFNLDPSIVSSSTINEAVEWNFQRKLAYARNLWWAFYSDGINMVYRTSSDGGTWSTATTVSAGGYNEFSIWQHDTNYFDYMVLGTSVLKYRRGLFGTNGQITWSAVEATVDATVGGGDGSIAVDSNGYPYIVYPNADSRLYITKSQYNNGTWSTAASYPMQLDPTVKSFLYASIVPLQSGRMYASFSNGTLDLPFDYAYGKLYTGATWLATEQITTTKTYEFTSHSILSMNDDVYFAFVDYTGALQFFKRTYGSGWSNPTIIGVRNKVSLSKDASTIHLFSGDSGTAGKIYWRTYDGTSWSTDATLPIGTYVGLTSLYEATSQSELAFLYTQIPVNVMFHKITTQPPEIPETEIPSGLQPTAPEYEEEKPPAEEAPPSILPRLGVWGILGAVGLITLGTVMAYTDQPQKRSSSKSSYQASQPGRSYYHKPPKSRTYRKIR